MILLQSIAITPLPRYLERNPSLSLSLSLSLFSLSLSLFVSVCVCVMNIHHTISSSAHHSNTYSPLKQPWQRFHQHHQNCLKSRIAQFGCGSFSFPQQKSNIWKLSETKKNSRDGGRKVTSISTPWRGDFCFRNHLCQR
ncbi:hypothetical protein ABFS82_08G098600 [Erythranthe guttata]